MDTFINIVIWYFIGYILSIVGIHLCNKLEQREVDKIGITHALQLGFLSWLLVIVSFIIVTGAHDKIISTYKTLNEKFKG